MNEKLRMIKSNRALSAGIILVLVLAGFVIYRHDNNRQRSAIAAKLASQYKAADNAKKPTKETAAVNDQKNFILSFYKDYLAAKNSDKGQSGTVAAYGTAKLEVQMNATTASYDVMTCGPDITPGSSSVSVGKSLDAGAGAKTYLVSIKNAGGKELAVPQVRLLIQNGTYLIDGIGCLGPV